MQPFIWTPIKSNQYDALVRRLLDRAAEGGEWEDRRLYVWAAYTIDRLAVDLAVANAIRDCLNERWIEVGQQHPDVHDVYRWDTEAPRKLMQDVFDRFRALLTQYELTNSAR